MFEPRHSLQQKPSSYGMRVFYLPGCTARTRYLHLKCALRGAFFKWGGHPGSLGMALPFAGWMEASSSLVPHPVIVRAGRSAVHLLPGAPRLCPSRKGHLAGWCLVGLALRGGGDTAPTDRNEAPHGSPFPDGSGCPGKRAASSRPYGAAGTACTNWGAPRLPPGRGPPGALEAREEM